MTSRKTDSVCSAGHGESRRQLICFTAAACVDRYLRIPEFRAGQINWPRRVTAQAGGKAINAARTARALGAPVRLVGLANKPVRDGVAAMGVPAEWAETDQGRECTVILDETGGELTQVYEPLPSERPEAWPMLCEAFRRVLRRAGPGDVLAISGRLPVEFPETALASLIAEARSVGVRSWIDSDDRRLRRCLGSRPDLVKINQHEAAAFTDTAITGTDSAVMAAYAFCEAGAASAIVTLGDQGCVYVDEAGHACHQPAPPVAHALPVGSGDAFLAGLGVAASLDHALSGALRFATAAASATAQQLVAGDITRNDVENAQRRVPCAVELSRPAADG